MIYKIIIADADQSHAEALAAYLERLDYQTAIAVSDKQLQTLFTEYKPDFIMADSELLKNGMDKWLKETTHLHPLTRMIVLANPEAMDHVMAEFMDDAFGFIVKPVKSLALDHMLHQARQAISMQLQLNQLQQELQERRYAQRRYRQLFDEMPCYVTVQDRELRITASNRLFKEHFGDEIGCHCYKIYKHRDSPCVQCPVATTFEDGQAHQTEEVVTSRTGVQYNILTWTAPIRDQSGRITQVVEMATNITKIRKLQDHLTSLGLMLGSMSHGVKGMLTALDGAVYQLESGLTRNDMPRIAAAVGETREMVDRIRNMVLQILYYAKSRELNYETMAISELADAVMSGVRSLAAKHGVALKLSVDPVLETIEIDSHWLQSALINVVENAIDACVDVHASNPRKVEVMFLPEGGRGLLIRVRDSGKGIDTETREKMFTLFFSSKGSQGTGLGLFIAHHVITQHGGTILVDSAPGKVTSFEIRLPLRRPSPVKSCPAISLLS